MQRALIALTLLAGSVSAQTVTFQYIPDGAVSANDMSPDGRYIVGGVDFNGDFIADQAYLWDRVSGVLELLPADVREAVAVSDDGQVVLGSMPDPDDEVQPIAEVAARWTASTGWVSLGYLPNALECPSRSNGYELSADGSVAVGLSWDGCSGRGFVWHEQDGAMMQLQRLASGGNRASVVSADGIVIAGFAQGTSGRTPAMWNGATGAGTLADPTGSLQGEFMGMNDDGSILLGTVYTGGADGVFDAVTWTAAGGMQRVGAGSLTVGWAGAAMDIDTAGTVVGFDYLLGNRRAWIKPAAASNLVPLGDWATSHGAAVPIALLVAQAISNDGRVICGHGGGTNSWILTVTPPCRADFDGDGFVSGIDFDLYVQAFEAGASSADFDGDGFVTGIDFDLYVEAYEAGC